MVQQIKLTVDRLEKPKRRVHLVQFPGIGNGALEKTGLPFLNSKYFNRDAAKRPFEGQGVELNEVHIPWHEIPNGQPQIPGLAIPLNLKAYYNNAEYQEEVMCMVSRYVDPLLDALEPNLICFQTHSFGAVILRDYLKRVKRNGKLAKFKARGGQFDILEYAPAHDEMLGGVLDSRRKFVKTMGMKVNREEITQLYQEARRVLALSIEGDPLAGRWMPKGKCIEHLILKPERAGIMDSIAQIVTLKHANHWGVITDKEAIKIISSWIAVGLNHNQDAISSRT